MDISRLLNPLGPRQPLRCPKTFNGCDRILLTSAPTSLTTLGLARSGHGSALHCVVSCLQ
ncbi:hypothetical protein SDRG_01840 [Saprolegnia diclina VS20]|uniref:Uncharacterized protein n=1 Tax=Saprolegnia diclina (strain VS20) TaxID=1156394 RepID=T0QRK1_SAPDV|nr:hypothetical protein SDRG_01840 [Saprolegnia diclina VS20]EQC40769.1 hypothetical protein SDRG_01840 [Saprolegnia diclina VS20]|eukprot:XP_008605613.1 hypothetical protein SDRG_01840 [Saprolegnia diclina VS20]